MPERGGYLRGAITLVACGFAIALASTASGQTVGYTGALFAVRGTYPTATVNSLYLFNTIDVAGGPVRVAASIPLMRIDSTTTFPALDGTALVTKATTTGLGDPLLRLDVRVLNAQAGTFQVGLAGAAKLPVVDVSTGRGTGVADYGIGGSAFKVLTRTSLMADVLFWKYGDPEGFDFADTWSYNFGVARTVGASGRWSTIASISGFSAGIGDEPPPLAFNIGVLTLAGRGQSFGVSASIGLNDSSSDFSVGTSWRFSR